MSRYWIVAVLAAVCWCVWLGSQPSSSTTAALIGLDNPFIVQSHDQVVNRIPLVAGYTHRSVVRTVGPLDLRAGDRVLVTTREQLDNNNRRAGGVWTERLMKRSHGRLRPKRVALDPRWSLWVGANLGVWRTSSPMATEGVPAIRETGENWDNWVHHWRYADQGWDVIAQDAPGAYYVTTLWLDTNPHYLLPGQAIDVTPRGSIEVAVFRN